MPSKAEHCHLGPRSRSLSRAVRAAKDDELPSNGTVKAFTVIELLVALSIICMLAWSMSTYRTFIVQQLFRAQVTQLYTTCHMLQQEALITQSPRTLTLDMACHAYYALEKRYQLSCQFKVPPSALGPPSNPARAPSSPVVGGTQNGDTATITWHQSGAGHAATLYLADTSGNGAAITIPRARKAPLLLYWWSGGKWNRTVILGRHPREAGCRDRGSR